MSEKHEFKLIETEGEYRIVDLTDTRIVGVTDTYNDFDGRSKELSIELYNAIRTKQEIGAKVVGYRVFVVLDDGNAGQFGDDEKEYLMKIMRQMAAYFKKEVIDVNPIYFCTSEIPVRPPSANKQENTKNIDKQSDSLLPSLEESETEPRIKKRKRNSTDVFFKILLGIFITVVLVALFFLIRFISHLGGILGFVVFILCAVAFIPEVLKGK